MAERNDPFIPIEVIFHRFPSFKMFVHAKYTHVRLGYFISYFFFFSFLFFFLFFFHAPSKFHSHPYFLIASFLHARAHVQTHAKCFTQTLLVLFVYRVTCSILFLFPFIFLSLSLFLSSFLSISLSLSLALLSKPFPFYFLQISLHNFAHYAPLFNFRTKTLVSHFY